MRWRSLEEASAVPETRLLRDVFTERKEMIAKYVPAEIQAIHARAISELRQSGIAERTLRPGTNAPSYMIGGRAAELIKN